MRIELQELPQRLAEILARAGPGGEIIVTEGGTPRAILRPLSSPKPRRAGLHAGAIQTAPDFDDPLPDEFWMGRP